MWDAHDVRHARWETVVQVSAGYFLYDLALVLFCMPELSGRWGTIAHHVIALVLCRGAALPRVVGALRARRQSEEGVPLHAAVAHLRKHTRGTQKKRRSMRAGSTS